MVSNDIIIPTRKSLDIVRRIAQSVHTFHHHYHILYDIAELIGGHINYLEIGTFYGGSACLMLQRKDTSVITIDNGQFVKKEIVINNLNKFCLQDNFFFYIEADSHQDSTKKLIKRLLWTEIDILFIDGDHSPDAIKSDFFLYEDLVRSGGYVIFDDYGDHIYNSHVKNIIDDLFVMLVGYEIIGTIKNIAGAKPRNIPNGNCFVIRKK